MATLPMYRRQVLGTGVQGGGNARSAVSANSPVGQGVENLGKGLTNLAQGQADQNIVAIREERDRVENEAAMSAANMLSEGQVYWQQNFQERSQAWSPGAPDMREGINKDFDKWTSDTAAKLPTEASRKYFEQHALGYKTRMLTGAYDYQQKTTRDALTAQTAVGINADERVVYGDPSQFQGTRDRRVETIRARTDLSDAEKITAVDKYDRGLALASERGELERDPAKWYEQRFGMPAYGAGSGSAGTTGIKAAIFGQESGGGKADTSKFNSQGVTGPMQIQQGTFDGMKRNGLIPQDWDISNPEQNKAAGDRWIDYLSNKYNGDPSKIAAAYYGGEKAVRADGTIARDMKNLSRPSDPTVGQYVDQVLGRMQKQPSAPLLASNGADAGPLIMPNAERGAAGQPISTAPKTFGALDYEQQSALMQQALTKIHQGDARYKAGITQQMKDAQAMHRDGIVDPVPMQEAQFTRAFGEEGPRLYQEYQNSRAMGADISTFKSAPSGDIARLLETTKPTAGEGYAAADQRQNIRLQAAQQVIQQRNADPAGFVTTNTPELKGLAARATDPQVPVAERNTVTQRYVTDSLAEQARLGITAPKVLTPAQADSIGQQAMAATRPEDSANLVSSLEAQYGQHFSRVFNELVAGKKIANEMLIIPNLTTPAARETVSRLARVKESDLSQGIDAKDQKTVKDLVTTNLETMAKTIPLLTEQSSEVMNAYETTMRKMAYGFIAAGQSPSDAVTRAQSALLGQYQFSNTMRIPRAVNESAATQGAQSRLYDSLDNIDVPRDLIAGARNADQVRAEWTKTVRARPLWFTNDDDSGVSLWAQGSDGVRYRITKGGAPVSFTWSELQLPIRTPQNVPQDMGGAAFVPPRGVRRQNR